MGSVCCCFHGGNFDEQANGSTSMFRHCICLNCLTIQFLHMYTTLFQRGELRAIPSSTREASASDVQIADDTACDTFRSPPRPLPYDDPRCSPYQRDGLISRREKASSHCHEESEPLRTCSNGSDTDSVSFGEKQAGLEYQGQSKLQYSESSLKKSSGELITGVLYFFASSEDEDVCPTCLEEYTSENPRIPLKCSHHFHLGCIYEWMERSESCPVCGKVMAFDETT